MRLSTGSTPTSAATTTIPAQANAGIAIQRRPPVPRATRAGPGREHEQLHVEERPTPEREEGERQGHDQQEQARLEGARARGFHGPIIGTDLREPEEAAEGATPLPPLRGRPILAIRVPAFRQEPEFHGGA